MHHRPFEIAPAFLLVAASLGGCATTWRLGSRPCDGPEVAPEEYEAYALYLRERIATASLTINRGTLLGNMPAPGGEQAVSGDPDARRLREVEEQQWLRNQVRDAAPEWRQAVADYERRSAGAGACLKRMPARAPDGLRSSGGGGTRTLSFSRVGFDAARRVAVFEIELSGPLPHDGEGGIVRLVKTADGDWQVIEHEHWIATR
jgi:hypothetical protein